MTKKGKIRLIVIGGIILIPILTLASLYGNYKQNLNDQPPYFELFIAKTFFSEDGNSCFDIVFSNQIRPIEWQLDPSQFETLDTVLLSLQNISGEKFYYTSWGAPFTRSRHDLIIYKNGLADTIPFGGHGCDTGVFAAPLKDNEIMTRTIYNPLMFDPYSNYDLALESDSFPDQFKSIYGDSVAIMFSQPTYSYPWNKYKSQMIFSSYIVISTDIVLNNWKLGKYAKLPTNEPPLTEHFGLKEFGQ